MAIKDYGMTLEEAQRTAEDIGAPPENIRPLGNGKFSVLVSPPKPIDSFEHGAIEESDMTEDELRNHVVNRLERIAAGILAIDEVLKGADRVDLTRILANLNAATMHVEDYYGC